MNFKKNLKLDWATHKAAEFACKNWHYSKCMPAGKTVKIGVWENDIFIGVVIYSYGANNNAAKSFKLTQYECCELTRVALNKHNSQVSRILSISLKLLKKLCPNLKLVFSYSDLSDMGHHGGIYQADNWLYLGERKTSNKGAYYIINGKQIHGRSARAKYGNEINFPKGWSHVPSKTKHLYVKIINDNYTITHNIYKYPKRVSSVESGTSDDQSERGGESPIDTLQNKEVF